MQCPPRTSRPFGDFMMPQNTRVTCSNPTVAYSGEIDKQRQAAQIMEDHLADEGLALRHVIGPDTGHKYPPGAPKGRN
ncbi:MAG: hypothetical protein CM1200mP29_11750 [Verrucomicrobiota bacterium]|nr:MAG: hypothetical protein CM1200mP29_11750 [Verrucomicrobiota bacterium]